MPQNWRAEDDRHRNDDRYGSDWRNEDSFRSGPRGGNDREAYARGRDQGYRDDYGRGGERYFSSESSYGNRPGWRDPSGAREQGGRYQDYGSGPNRDYGRGPYEDYGSGRGQGAREEHYFGGGTYPRSDFSYGHARDEDASRFSRDRQMRRPDWGREEWGMSGPQQTGRGAYGRDSSYGRESYGREGYSGRDADRNQERGLWDRATDEVSSWFGDEAAERRRREDEYRGRGPKNYSRSDDRVREDVSDRLTDDWQVDASDIEVAASGGEVTLTGTVADRTQRRRAEDVAEQVSGVRHVQNNLRVRDFASGLGQGNTAHTAHTSGLTGQGTTGTTGQNTATQGTTAQGVTSQTGQASVPGTVKR
ncbi:BON domain-containing protein [Roseixanthobacter pseudopolyaromaticivorans]|uniref:BON domain-containing protein n=1 Tax=Xanthobacteraceae TaxID=335928 RepID=UPI00372D0219